MLAKATPTFHPQRDDDGNLVKIKSPSQPTPLSAWSQADAIACVIPLGETPGQINGIRVSAWIDHPVNPRGWESIAMRSDFAEQPFKVPPNRKAAAGVVIREPDGRVWVVAPTNAFAGYRATFPKGRLDGASARTAALREAFEESGLQVRLLRHLIDVERSESFSRYYLAERVGGDPAAMGWESQAVMLVPVDRLPEVLNSPYDKSILSALNRLPHNESRIALNR